MSYYVISCHILGVLGLFKPVFNYVGRGGEGRREEGRGRARAMSSLASSDSFAVRPKAFHMHLRLLIYWTLKSYRALSAHSAAEFNISPGRWQHLWLVAIVSPKRWGKMGRNDCHTAWGNFKTLISSLYHYKNYACFFSLFVFFKK
jgi:hypothetical protein